MYQDNIIADENIIGYTEILITDLKMRRLAHETIGPSEKIIESPQEEDMIEAAYEDPVNQKNLLLAGTALQARHSS